MLLTLDLLPTEEEDGGVGEAGSQSRGQRGDGFSFSACVSKSSQLRRGTGVCWSFYLAFSSLLPLSSPCVKQLVGFVSGGQGI